MKDMSKIGKGENTNPKQIMCLAFKAASLAGCRLYWLFQLPI